MLTDVLEVLTASLHQDSLTMEIVSISDTLVDFYENAWHEIPERWHLRSLSVLMCS
jgi:hypothetical protein